MKTDTFIKNNLSEIISFRKELHANPEVSGKEIKTAERVEEWLKDCKPDRLITNIGGEGIAAVFGQDYGKSLLFRAELDALPISDNIEAEYKSRIKGVGHKCGHDGHMANLAGLALWLKENRPKSGNVMLLFQPSEETGEGAAKMLSDPKLKQLGSPPVIAMHNLPGFEKGDVIIKDDVFTFASTGMIIQLEGATSHAAHPEGGISPSLAVSEIIQLLENPTSSTGHSEDMVRITVIHTKIGEQAFGTSPGEAVVMATIRSAETEIMDAATKEIESNVKKIVTKFKLSLNISYTERFETTRNDAEMADVVRKAAKDCALNIQEIEKPFPWSEDFGRFTGVFPGVLFGMGAGVQYPQLHHPKYDYPDELVPVALRLYIQIMNDYFGLSEKESTN